MEALIICSAALLASALTLFSGFGIGTLLMPVFAIFFPLELAIAMTAIVHLANNLFKLALLGRKADFSILVKFGLPAVLASFAGALLLTSLGEIKPILEHQAFGRVLEVSPVKLVVGLLIVLFVLLESFSSLSNIELDRKWLPLGGIISGFFGGLSGHQGAFRSMFLIKSGLEKEAFIATGIVIAVIVDISRMVIYAADFISHGTDIEWPLIILAGAAAFAGSYFGNRILKKVTIRSVKFIVSALLIVVAVGLITGLI